MGEFLQNYGFSILIAAFMLLCHLGHGRHGGHGVEPRRDGEPGAPDRPDHRIEREVVDRQALARLLAVAEAA